MLLTELSGFTIVTPHIEISALFFTRLLYKNSKISDSMSSSPSKNPIYSPVACLIPVFLATETPWFF